MIDAKSLFSDYWNNYLTVDRLASDYGITANEALELIALGRIKWNEDAKKNRKETKHD